MKVLSEVGLDIVVNMCITKDGFDVLAAEPIMSFLELRLSNVIAIHCLCDRLRSQFRSPSLFIFRITPCCHLLNKISLDILYS